MTDEFSPLTVQDYTAQALTTDQRSDSGSLTFPLLGLFGETGSLLSEVKKKQRDQASYVGYAAAVVEELGDVLWYLTAVASRGGLTLGDIAANLNRGFSDWQRAGAAPLSFASLQPEIMPRPTEPSAAFEKTPALCSRRHQWIVRSVVEAAYHPVLHSDRRLGWENCRLLVAYETSARNLSDW